MSEEMNKSGSSPTLSVCMIIKNEADHLTEALASLKDIADEIIVVDTGSTDNSKEIARRFTPHVFDFPWCDDFAAARNVSLEKASGDYILWIDADDQIDEKNQEKIRRLKDRFDGKNAFFLILQDIDSTGPSHCLFQIRCVPRKEEVRFWGRIHEHLSVGNLKLVQTDITVHHHGYKDQALVDQKIQRNLAILEKELAEGRDDEQIHFYLAISYNHQGKADKALAAMEKALEWMERKQGESPTDQNGRLIISPFLSEAYILLADLYTKRDQTPKALRYMAKAYAFAEESAHIFQRLAGIHQQMNQHSRALALFREALNGKQLVSVIPRKPLSRGKLYVEMAFSALSLNDGVRGKEYLTEACKLGIPIHECWEELGHKAMDAQAFASGLLAYEEAIRTGGLSSDGFSNLALLYSKQGLLKKSIEAYETALTKTPGNCTAQANLAHLRLRLGHLQTARSLFQRLIDEGRKDWDILLAMALIMTKENDKEGLAALLPLLRKTCRSSFSECVSEQSFLRELALKLEAEGKAILAGWAREVGSFYG